MFSTITISDILNQPDKQVDFNVDKFEDMAEPENIEYPHKHNFYEILWVTKGKSKHTIDYKDYEILPDTLFFISPGQLHLFEEWDNIKGYCIIFTEQFFLQIFQNKNILFELSYLDNLHDTPFLQLKKADKIIIQPIIDLLYQECKSGEQSSETIQALLLVFLRRIQKLFAVKNAAVNSKHKIVIFKQFKKLVEINFYRNLSMAEYASQLNISPHHLNTLVKAVSGKTTTKIIKERIILEAQQLLNFSELTVSQIADRLEFDDNSYFARYFKKQIGLSPQDFRKNLS